MRKPLLKLFFVAFFILINGYTYLLEADPLTAEDKSGQLDIDGSQGISGSLVTIPIRIQSAPNDVSSLGFEVTIPSMLTYYKFEWGELVGDFEYFDCKTPEDGIIRCGGFKSTGGISEGARGDVVNLQFEVAMECNDVYQLELQNLIDGFFGWSTSPGTFDCARCLCDVNGDEEITPEDGLCAFQKYLKICPTDCGACENICCDVNQDDNCTPQDSLEIYEKYVGGDSLCTGSVVHVKGVGNGDYIRFGGSDWIMLDNNVGYIILKSNDATTENGCLEGCRAFDKSNNQTWEYNGKVASLNIYLNNEFYNNLGDDKAFIDENGEWLIVEGVSTPSYVWNGKIGLLTKIEFEYFRENGPNLTGTSTKAIDFPGNDPNIAGNWWLLTPGVGYSGGSSGNVVRYIDAGNYISASDASNCSTNRWLRPTLHMRKGLYVESGTGTIDDPKVITSSAP